MQPSRRNCLLASLALAVCALLAPRARGNTLTVTSAPSGATVEIDGVVIGTTPCAVKYPGGYFHKTHTVFGQRLEHSITVRIYMEGFTSQEVKLTDGPFEWVSLNGQDHGHYWLLKTNHVEAKLEPISTVFNQSVHKSLVAATGSAAAAELPAEKVVEIASPAVVKLRSSDGWGTGFLISETGILATNHHVAEGQVSMDVIFSNGARLLGKVIYTDRELDLAIVKVEGSGFPHLSLAEVGEVRPGQTVLAIGNPDQGLPNTVTKGIVSAVGPDRDAGNGTWIQTDAAINSGNSGGPLLNMQAQVVGVNSQKRSVSSDDRPLEGIGFALSASDLANTVSRLFPDQAPPPAIGVADKGVVSVTSEPLGAEIYVDGSFVGQTPSTLRLASGSHRIELRSPGKKEWQRNLEISKDSEVTLHPVLESSP